MIRGLESPEFQPGAKSRLRVKGGLHIYLIDRVAVAGLGEICPIFRGLERLLVREDCSSIRFGVVVIWPNYNQQGLSFTYPL